MKREYSKPSMNIEVFQANEYIAACNSYTGELPNTVGIIYTEQNNKFGYQHGEDKAIFTGVQNYKKTCKNENHIGTAKFQTYIGVKKYVFDVDYGINKADFHACHARNGVNAS